MDEKISQIEKLLTECKKCFPAKWDENPVTVPIANKSELYFFYYGMFAAYEQALEVLREEM